jgi:hypothetical protein
MKVATIFRQARGLLLIPLLAAAAWLPAQAQAQDLGYVEPSVQFSREELTQMLAPIALYPDALLAQILMASTYPIEVIEADRWVSRHPGLEGDALDEALLDMYWDPSVKALCHFPSILALMSERIGETTNLGNAFLAQEDDVMDVVQELRARAYAAGNLASSGRQKVIVRDRIIIIEPVNPRVIYVPYYDPVYVYGPWWYPAYPPYYWGPPGVHIGVGISYWPGVAFGFVFGGWSYLDWPRHVIVIHVQRRPRYVRHDHWFTDSGHWHHSPSHRRGVAYPDLRTAREYGQYPRHGRDFGRDLRGFPETTHRDRDRGGEASRRTDRGGRVGEPTTTDRERRTREPTPATGTVVVPRTSDRQGRETSGRTVQPRDTGGRERQVRPRTGEGGLVAPRGSRDTAARPERRVDRSRDNIFNRVDDAGMERRSSKRGQTSRQSRPAGRARDSGRPMRGDRGGRDEQPPGGR